MGLDVVSKDQGKFGVRSVTSESSCCNFASTHFSVSGAGPGNIRDVRSCFGTQEHVHKLSQHRVH